MYRIGVVGTEGGWSSERLADEVARQTGYRLLVDISRVKLDLQAGKVFLGDIDLTGLDALMVKKIGARYSPDLLDRLEILRFLSGRGLPIFSPPESIMRVLDRLSCTVTLRLNNIPMPPTVITEDEDIAVEAVRDFGQAVFKPLFTSKARGMSLISDREDVRDKVRRFHSNNPIMYIQQRIELQGKDLGLAFLGGEYLTTYARYNRGVSWNTSTASGGRYVAYNPSKESIELARRAQALFDLDFTSVDVVESRSGPMVFEVSAFGGFRGLLEAQGIDAAKLYTEYVLDKLGRERQRRTA
jgi:ribosomal protein S6--L-glutamate ligase